MFKTNVEHEQTLQIHVGRLQDEDFVTEQTIECVSSSCFVFLGWTSNHLSFKYLPSQVQGYLPGGYIWILHNHSKPCTNQMIEKYIDFEHLRLILILEDEMMKHI